MADPSSAAHSDEQSGAQSGVRVAHAPERHRYEVLVDGELAGFAEYRRRSGDDGSERFVFTHTEIGDEYEGRGLASQLARGALDDVRSQGEQVVPVCSFIAGWIDKHPDYGDIVDRPLTEQLAHRD